MFNWMMQESKRSHSSQFFCISVGLLFCPILGHTAMEKSCEGEGISKKMEHYRADGVKITHDPYAPGMAEKYGMPGKTDQ